MLVSSPVRISRAEKLIHRLGLDKLFDDDVFIETISDEVERMFQVMRLSILMVTAKLPEFLLTLDEVKRRIQVLGAVDQKEVLHCLSDLIVAKSQYNYGVEGKYGIQRSKRFRT